MEQKKETNQQQVRQLLGYLREFLTPVDEKTRADLNKALGDKTMPSMYVEGTWENLKRVATWALLHWGQVNYKAESSYDVVNRFLGITEEDTDVKKPFYNTEIPVLVLYHLETTLPNKYTADCIVYVWEARRAKNLPTIILSCCSSQTLYDFFQKHGVKVLKMDKGLKRMKAEVGSVEREKEVDKIAKEAWFRAERERQMSTKEKKKEAVNRVLKGDFQKRAMEPLGDIKYTAEL